ncbi:MAG: TlyA family RNA methyltransferase [Ruminococcus sp.]|nr:TlyA family RNA methyltransferase [Ruminococcus sp.]
MARLDAELVARGIARSRERAKEMIKSGAVTVNGKPAKKSSAEVSAEDILESAEQELYVGRGALKLEKAAEYFSLNFSGMRCLDIGASTGGFTEYMINHGAVIVYAVDVGHGQLAESLRRDSRVVNMENTDIRAVTDDDTGGQVDFVCADVSFISLTKILPKISELLKDGGTAAVLVKPQFEAGKSDIGKKGIVKDRKVHLRILNELDSFMRLTGLMPVSFTYSPIKGGSGNIEYLAKLVKCSDEAPRQDFVGIVEEAFRQL